jgi:hypothetical protein
MTILAPVEMRTLLKQFGGTLDMLSERTKLSKTQLSQYMNARNGLTVPQVTACKQVLLSIARDRSQMLSKLLAPEMDDEKALLELVPVTLNQWLDAYPDERVSAWRYLWRQTERK